MAKFLENTSDINRSIKKKKKKQETVARPQSPSAPKQQRAQQAQNQKTYGGMPQPQQQTVKRPSTSSSKSTSKSVSRNVSQQTQRTVDRLQQKYGTNNQSRTQSRTASRPQTQTKRYQPHTAERLSERREQIRADRNRANSNQATLDRLQDRYGRNKGHNRWNEELKPEQAETAKDRLKEKFATGKVRGGEETKLDEAGRVTKRIGKAFGQGAELAVTEDRKLLNKFSNPSTSNKFYNRELNPEDMEKNKKKLALRDEGLRQKILKQQEDMSKLEAQGGSYLERMAIQGAQSAGGMAVDALAGPMSLVHMGARVTEGSYVAEEEKVRKLRQRVEESGQYTPEEIDEMFKDMDKRIMASALSEAAIEVLTEKMFGGIGMASKVVGGKGFLDAAASKLTGRLGASVAGRMLRGTAEEIAEEEVGNPAQAAMSNLIMNNRLNEINQDVTRRGIEAQSTDLISRIGSEEDARAVAANLNSESFLDEAAAGFRESGASKKEAQELAEMTRDYLYASVTGDTEKAEEIREKMVDKLAGEEQYKEKWTLQDAIDVAVSTGLMTAATGAPGAITSAAVGANYKSEKGVQGVKKLAELTKSLDPEKSARAQAVIDRIDSGKDVSNSQVYEIMSWSQEATAEATKREQTKDSIVRRKMEEENLLVPASTRASDGSYMLSPKTEDRFEQIADETMEKFEQMTIEDSETDLSEEDKYTIADAVAAFQTGTITAEQINELNYDRPAARKVFKEVTGIDLDQYNEKTKAGNINEAASNVRMQEALFARAAENYVESARAEQAHWDNVTRGEYVEQLESNNRMGSEGSKALTTAIKSVDPRDQRKLMRMGAAANSLYERALYSNDSWEDVRAEAAKNFSSLDISALKAVFDSGKADRAIQETAFYGRAVKANAKLTKKSLAEAEQVAVPGEVVNKTGRTVTADDLLFLQSVADTLNIKVEAVDIEPRYEGWFTESTGVLTVNLNEGVKKPLRMVVTHELTHSNIYAPDEFMKLLRYIGDAWYKADPAGYKAAIDERKARYKKDQELNDLDALEEIVADGSIDYNFWNDEDFAATLATEDPGLAQKFLNAIRELLRKIRSILADQPAELEDDRVYTSLYADAIDMAEAERLMLNALKAARQVRANQAIDEWDANARQNSTEEAKTRQSINDDDYMSAVESGDMETAQRMVDEAAQAAGYTLRGYHGTNLPTLNENYEPVDQTDYANKILPYTIFRPGLSGGIYVATNKEYSEAISKGFTREKGTVMGLYVKFENPLVVNEHVYDSVPRYFNIPTPSIMKQDGYNQETLSTEEISEYAQNNGYDGVIIEGIREGGDIYTDDYIAFSSDHLKLADPVTYDDNGDVIPLSERFNEESPDIRYSISLNDKSFDELNDAEKSVIHEAVSPDIRFSMPTERDVLPKARYKSGIGFSNAISAISGKQARINALVKNGFSEKQAKQIGEAISNVILDTGNWIEGDLQSEFTFIGWDDLINAEVSVRKDWKGKVVGVSVSAMVANGEYPVNFDLTTICNKREGIMQVIQNLTRIKTDTGKSVLDSVKLTDQDMWNINKALKAEGIDTACLGCFVEARRYYTNRFIASIDNKWNTAVRETRRQLGLPEEEYFNFAHGKEVTGEDYTAISDLWTSYEKSKDTKKSPEQRIRILMNEIIKNKEVDSPYLKLVSASDILTPEGISGLKQISTGKHDLVKTLKSIYGTSAPKEILAFTPYNSEIALLPKNLKGQRADKYLRSIGGIRIQSFSDFKIEHVIDHMQMVADMAARKFTCHAYSKVIAFPRIFGLTGQKINMSVMFDITPAEEWQTLLGCSEEKAKEYAFKYAGLRFVTERPAENPDNRPYIETELEGVHGYLTYLLGDADYISSVYEEEYQKNIAAGMDENEARRKANEAKPFEQSINYREAVELENQEGYKENVGIIAVAYGDEHLKILLADPNVRYVIPYHKSGLPVFVSEKTSLQYARNYEPVQNTKKADPKEKLQERFNAFKEKYKGEYPAIAFFGDIYENGGSIATTEATATEAAKLHGTGEFDVYKDLDKANDIKEVANAYLEDCIENNLVPVFSEFAGDPNYYKMLFDFAVTDGTSDHIYPQKTVRNNYPGIDVDAKIAAGEKITEDDYAKLRKAIRKGASEENVKNQTRSENMQNVLDDILSKDSENSILAGTNVNAIRDSATDYTDPKAIEYSITPEMDEEYMDAVSSNDMEEAQRLVDEAAERAGYTTSGYHGTYANFTVFNIGKSGANWDGYSRLGPGAYFAYDESAASRWSDGTRIIKAYLSIKKPLDLSKPMPADLYEEVKSYIEKRIEEGPPEWAPISKEAYVNNLRSSEKKYYEDPLSFLTNFMYDPQTDEMTDGMHELVAKYGYDGLASDEEMVVFDPSQIKSADAVTYAEDGSVIPLSERFDPNNDDIRYSMSTVDSDGNVLSNGQMEYFKNSQARDAEGKLLVLYHTSPEEFTVFDSDYQGENTGYDNTAYGFFVTDDPAFSSRFGENQMKLYANITKLAIHPWGAGLKYSDAECERITRDWLELTDPEQLEYYEEAREDDPELSLYDYYTALWGPAESPDEYAEDYREILEDEGYDAIEIFEGTEEQLREDGTGTDRPVTTYAVFRSEMLKDTRNTDPTNNPDIRYSLTEEDDVIAYASENAESTDELWYTDPELEEGRIRYSMSKQDFIEGKIRKWNPAWLTEGRALEPKSVEKSIREVVMGAMAQSDTPARYRQTLVKSLVVDAQKAFAYMKDGKESEAAALLYDSAHEMIESAKFFMDDDAFNRYKELRDYFSGFKISIEEKYYSDIDIVTYRRNNMGNILIGKNGTMIDEIWEDLCDKWPEYFSMEVEHPAEMLEALEHAFKVAKPVAVAYSSEEAMDFAGDIADDLYDIVYEGKELVSLADKYQAKAKAMKQRHKEAMQAMKQKLEDQRERHAYEVKSLKEENRRKLKTQKSKYEFEIAELKQNREYNIKRLKAENRRALKEERQKRKDEKARKKAAMLRQHMLDKIGDDYNWLVKRVLDPTKDKYVPEEFRKSLAEFLQMLDLQTENSKKLEAKTGRVSQKTFKMRELKDRLENMAKTKTEDGVSMFELDSYVPYILESLTEKTEKYGGTIDSLDISDVKEIGILMKAIRHNLDNYNKRIKAEKAEEISAIGANVVADQLKRVDKRGAAKKYGGTRDTMDIINTAALTPAYFFDRLGPAMKSMYDELRYEGFDAYVRNEQLIIRRLNDILGKYHKQRKLNKNKPKPGSTIEEWRDDRSLHTIQLKTNPEKTIEMTTAQIMSLYCLQKRKQALQHMLKGGIHITPIQSGSKIQKLKDREKGKVESAESVPLTIEDIQEIVAQLTPEQKQIADDLQQLMAVDMAKLGNQAHREMYGYEIFDDPEYFPIKSRSNEIATDVNNVGEVVEKIKSFGPAKPLDPKASNIIEVDDIFSVVADHCNGMNLYNAYLVPISDFVRVYNAKIMQEDGRSLSVKDALEMAHGKKAMTYINNFLRDINGIKAVQRGGLEDVMNKALGTAKRTAVFGNIRVALQQPTAIVRALAVMDPKHFVPLLKVKPQKGVREEMYRYCPIAQWKSWGFYDTYMGRDIEDVMMNNWSGMDVALSGIYGELDNWTWSLIWRAVKAEQAKAHPDMDTKSEEFLQMCGRRASEVFDRTQVVDSTFHRSDAMRSKQVAVKTFTAFMAEPTLTLNVFRAGIENAREEWLDGNKGKAMGTFNRALSVIILQAAIVAAAQSFADAWRDKDPGWPGDGDDDDKEKESDYWTRWVNNYVANLFDGLHLENNIYLVKDITPYFNYMISKVAEHGDWNPWIRAAMGWDQEYLYGESNLVMSALENTATGVSQIYKKIEKGDEYEKTWYDIVQKTVSGPSTFLGFPLGTLMRDTKPIWTNILGVTFADDGSAEMPKPSKQIEGIEDGSTVDNILNHFGINLSPAEQKAKADAERNEEIEKQIGKISDKASGLTGLDKDKKIWSAVTTYYKDDGHSLSSMVENGNFSEIYRMQSMYTRAGGDSEYFVERVMAESKKALKKSIIYDPTEEQVEAQRNVREYLLGHGMSEQELSDIVYKSDTAREMKIAFRLNDKDAMMEELKPLVVAGLTYQDLERLWENRKRVNLKTYNGKYKDRLKSTGTYNWPISGQITSRFGHRSSPGGIGSTNHQGLDIAGNMGDPVGAADGGTVIYSGWYGGAGKTVMIEHDDGTVTQYSHLSWYEAKVGDVVAQGQTVGNVGSTGNSTGPHLHFGVKVNGSYVDPLEYLNS